MKDVPSSEACGACVTRRDDDACLQVELLQNGDLGGSAMTRLALHGLRSRQDVQDLSAEDRKTYRRWARGSCAVYAIALAVLFAGFWLHDRTVMVAQSLSEAGNSPRGGQDKGAAPMAGAVHR
jgi:hypothetical protein